MSTQRVDLLYSMLVLFGVSLSIYRWLGQLALSETP